VRLRRNGSAASPREWERPPGNHLIELYGDLARTRTYMHVLSTDFSGVYRCVCARTEAGWRIRDYRFVLHTRAHPAPQILGAGPSGPR
jgi:hypothetical protein